METFRAPFHVEGALALESVMDLLAVKPHLNHLELRLRNHAAPDPAKNRPYSSDPRLGRPLNLGLLEYKLPTLSDILEIECADRGGGRSRGEPRRCAAHHSDGDGHRAPSSTPWAYR